MFGIGITLIPMSWAFDYWDKGHKKLLAIGPLRFVVYNNLPKWKEEKSEEVKAGV